ncbi:MAG: hypothetical protein WA417_08605 [Stellaceae bacterium]
MFVADFVEQLFLFRLRRSFANAAVQEMSRKEHSISEFHLGKLGQVLVFARICLSRNWSFLTRSNGGRGNGSKAETGARARSKSVSAPTLAARVGGAGGGERAGHVRVGQRPRYRRDL